MLLISCISLLCSCYAAVPFMLVGEVVGNLECSNCFEKIPKAPMNKGSYNDEMKKDGLWEIYYTSGQGGNLKLKASFKDGIPEGPWETYDVSGKLESKGSYKDGQKEGPWENYYVSGKLKSKGSYKDGQQKGPWEFYYASGKLRKKMSL